MLHVLQQEQPLVKERLLRLGLAHSVLGRHGAMKPVGRRLPLAYTKKSLFSRPNIAAPQLLP
jgi:hypothetical protein